MFADHVDYTTAAAPFRVAVSDFNGDGNLDVVTANAHGYPYDISVLLGNGDGTFRPKVDYASDGPGYCIVAGDFNGDGKQDIAEAPTMPRSVSCWATGAAASRRSFLPGWQHAIWNRRGRLRRRREAGPGDGEPTSRQRQRADGERQRHIRGRPDYGLGIQPQDLAVGDFNGDGRQDLVLPNYNANSVRICWVTAVVRSPGRTMTTRRAAHTARRPSRSATSTTMAIWTWPRQTQATVG